MSPSRLATRLAELLDTVALLLANLGFVVILLTICWNVVSRHVLSTPVSWAEDITSIAFGWLIFAGAAAVHNRRGHIGVDLVPAALPAPVRRLLDAAIEIFVAVFCAYAAILCGEQAIISHTTARTPVLGLPLSALFASLAFGFAVMALSSALHLAGVRPFAKEA